MYNLMKGTHISSHEKFPHVNFYYHNFPYVNFLKKIITSHSLMFTFQYI